MFFVIPYPQSLVPNLSPCPSSPDFREPISVAVPFDLLRRGAMMQKVNVGHGRIKMDNMVRRRELPCVRRQDRCMESESFVMQ
jgi:hypothetical protein